MSLLLGLISGAVMLGLILVGSDGTEPRAICEFVNGGNGFLPLNPNKGGIYSYSCNLNISLATFYILSFGAIVSVFIYYASTLLLVVFYPFTKLRIPRNDIDSPATDERRPE